MVSLWNKVTSLWQTVSLKIKRMIRTFLLVLKVPKGYMQVSCWILCVSTFYSLIPTPLNRYCLMFVKNTVGLYGDVLISCKSHYRNGTFSGHILLSADAVCIWSAMWLERFWKASNACFHLPRSLVLVFIPWLECITQYHFGHCSCYYGQSFRDDCARMVNVINGIMVNYDDVNDITCILK